MTELMKKYMNKRATQDAFITAAAPIVDWMKHEGEPDYIENYEVIANFINAYEAINNSDKN